MDNSHLSVADLKIRPAITITPGTVLVEAAILLAEVGDGVLVVDDDPIREITEHDIVVAFTTGASGTTTVSEIAPSAPLFVSLGTPADEVARIMMRTPRRAVVVVDDDRVVGVVEFPAVISALWDAGQWSEALRVAAEVGAAA